LSYEVRKVVTQEGAHWGNRPATAINRSTTIPPIPNPPSLSRFLKPPPAEECSARILSHE